MFAQRALTRISPGPGAAMSEDAKLGFILLFMVFAIMVIGPALAN
jgi:hypothetical protein